MGIINSVTMLAIVLAGAALVREREHGTMDHLLVMPLTPFEIAISKIWANGLVIVIAVGLSLYVVVRGLLGIPIAGSVPLFLFGAAIYLFFETAVGLLLGAVYAPSSVCFIYWFTCRWRCFLAAIRRSRACRRGSLRSRRCRRPHISFRSRRRSSIAGPASPLRGRSSSPSR
jgi:ABC-type transport system involved in multi-copper enzyme maturation permease subunit